MGGGIAVAIAPRFLQNHRHALSNIWPAGLVREAKMGLHGEGSDSVAALVNATYGEASIAGGAIGRFEYGS